jgi:Tfp pilus assembly protein PilV
MMQPINTQRGFSVLEVAIAAFLTVGLMGIVFGLVNRHQAIFTSETNTTDMNQNMRVAMDMLTRDLQTAGMGLPEPSGTMDAIYYVNGTGTNPDAMLLLNGDAYAPSVDVDSLTGTTFTCTRGGDIVATGSGGSSQFSYTGASGATLRLFQAYGTSAKNYLVYDTQRAMVMQLQADAQTLGASQLTIQYNGGTFRNPATLLSNALGGVAVADSGAPADYTIAKIALLNTMVAYRVNVANRELERTEDLTNWYAVARGITDMQIRYRCISLDVSGNPVETMEDAPPDRGRVRAVEVKLTAETADLPPSAPGYRRVVMLFEVSPRNFNLLNNVNLSSSVD